MVLCTHLSYHIKAVVGVGHRICHWLTLYKLPKSLSNYFLLTLLVVVSSIFDGVGTQYNAIGDMPQEGRPPY